jgi:peptidylprolyl isomerase
VFSIVRRLLALLVASLMLFTTAACGGDPKDTKDKTKADVDTGQTIKGLTVTGKFGAEPQVKVDPAVTVDKPETQVLSVGDGNPVLANKKAMFNIYLARGNGEKLFSSLDKGQPMQVAMQENQFFKVIIDSLVGKPQGSRVAVAATVKDVWGAAGVPQLKLKTGETVLFVLDVLSVEPTDVDKAPSGKKVTPPAGAPVVEQSGGKVTGLDFSKSPKRPPKKLQVIPLIEGDGPAAESGRLVTFNYYGAVWGSKKPFDSSFTRGEPTPFGVGVRGLIPAWDKAIPGLRKGSRVLIIAPPGEAYGSHAQQGIPKNSTLAFVVDVLGVDS